uniref:(northern house mosquito) hypothetical protein n=1 Tax=Culex pipiens TaxID=7175 RepID=A0A8D8IEI8_CULPI
MKRVAILYENFFFCLQNLHFFVLKAKLLQSLTNTTTTMTHTCPQIQPKNIPVRHPRPRPTRRRTQMTRKPSTFPHNNNNNGYGYTRIQPQPPPYYYGNQYNNNNNNNIYNNPYYYYYTQYYANQANRRPLDSRPKPSEPTAVYYRGSPYYWRPGRRRTSSFFY